MFPSISFSFPCYFFSNDTATTEIYTLSLHDALPILHTGHVKAGQPPEKPREGLRDRYVRSEEHTSELQSHHDLVCRLLLEKKKQLGMPSSTSSRLPFRSFCTSTYVTNKFNTPSRNS